MTGDSNGGKRTIYMRPLGSPCAICRSYQHFTKDHPEGYVNPMYDALREAEHVEAFNREFVPHCDTEGL